MPGPYHFPDYSRDRRYQYHLVELPAFPQMLLLAALRLEDYLLFFSLKGLCAEQGLNLDYKTQYDKVMSPGSQYLEYVEKVPFPTKGGEQKVTGLEFQGLSKLLINLQEERISDPVQQENLRRFRRAVFRAAEKILAGIPHAAAVTLPADHTRPELPPAQSAVGSNATPDVALVQGDGDTEIRNIRDLVLFSERRIGLAEAAVRKLYDAVFLSNGEENPEAERSDLQGARVATCPHCGKPIIIERLVLRGVDAD